MPDIKNKINSTDVSMVNVNIKKSTDTSVKITALVIIFLIFAGLILFSPLNILAMESVFFILIVRTKTTNPKTSELFLIC